MCVCLLRNGRVDLFMSPFLAYFLDWIECPGPASLGRSLLQLASECLFQRVGHFEEPRTGHFVVNLVARTFGAVHGDRVVDDIIRVLRISAPRFNEASSLIHKLLTSAHLLLISSLVVTAPHCTPMLLAVWRRVAIFFGCVANIAQHMANPFRLKIERSPDRCRSEPLKTLGTPG